MTEDWRRWTCLESSFVVFCTQVIDLLLIFSVKKLMAFLYKGHCQSSAVTCVHDGNCKIHIVLSWFRNCYIHACQICSLYGILWQWVTAGMGQYIDFPIFFNILVMLILILILNSGFPKYRYWSWSWNLQVQNLDFDIDIEKNGILISILILILRKNSKIIEK